MPYRFRKKWRGQIILPDGRTKQKTCATRAEAMEWEAMARREALAPAPEVVTPSGCLLDWATAYLADAVRHAKKTVNEKRNEFRRLFQAVDPDTPWAALTKRMALDYLTGQFKTRSGYAANKSRKNLASAWAWAQEFVDGFPQGPNPWRAVRKFGEQRQPRYVPPEGDFWKVVDVAQGQDKVMLLTLLYTAGRKGEVFRLTWPDVDFAGSRIRLGTRKRQDGSMEWDWVPMDEDLFAVLLAHRRAAVNEWVFVQTVGRHAGKPYTENRGFPQELCRAAGVREFGCHAIRHLTASILASAGTPVHMIQEILRHKRLTTTDRYIKTLDAARPFLRVLSRKRTGNVHLNVPKQEALKAATRTASLSP